MSNSIAMPSKLEERIRLAADVLNEERRVRVISHYDSDGISAAAVLCGMLKNSSKAFHTTMSRNLDRRLIEKIKSEKNSLVIFSDMGSGQLDLIAELETKAIVLDHHKVTEDSDSIVHINPSMWGFNGTTDVSGATTAFLLAQYVNDANWEYSVCALAGAYGDMQHLGGYRELNLQILRKAIEKGLVEERTSLSLQGEDLFDAVVRSAEPFFRGYSGRSEAVTALCTRISVDPELKFVEYADSDTKKIASVLMLMLASNGCDYENIAQLISPQHLGRTGITVSEMSSLANACGRSERYSVGLAMELGDATATSEARKLRSEYSVRVLERLIPLEEGIEQMKHIQFFGCDDGSLAGALCGLYMAFIGEKSKPTIAYSLSGDSYKISARGTRALVSKGLDLAAGLSAAAKAAGGVGGGHVIASGATVPKEGLRAFLDELDEITGSQLVS